MKLDGTIIRGAELNSLRSRALEDVSVNEIINLINNFLPTGFLKKTDLSVEFAYKGDLPTEGDVLISVSKVNLINDQKTVRIAYNESDSELFPNDLKVFAQVIEPDNTLSAFYSFNSKGEVEEEIINNYQSSKLPEIKEQLIDNPNYKVKSPEEQVVPAAWWLGNGCLPGGYQHCGKNCGYNGTHGGKAPINQVDSCCVLHDRCYANGKNKKCKCDTLLRNCVAPWEKFYWAATGILTYFKGC